MMDSLYVFLIRNDVWIYILCALGFVWYAAQLIRSRRMLKRSIFGLEIERGRRIMSRSLLLVALFIIVAAAVTYVNLSIAPTLPPELLKPPTPTPNIFATPMSSPTPAGGQPTATIFLAPTVTLAAPGAGGASDDLRQDDEEPLVSPELPAAGELPQPTVQASPSPRPPANACSPGISITSPPNGASVSSAVTFFGSAAAESFSYYDLEVSGPQTDGVWTSLPLEDAVQPVFDGILASIDVSTWQPGLHSFRLTVYGASESPVGQCEVQLSVDTGSS
jgi:hypothetical protein